MPNFDGTGPCRQNRRNRINNACLQNNQDSNLNNQNESLSENNQFNNRLNKNCKRGLMQRKNNR